jgi:hypothetical protein
MKLRVMVRGFLRGRQVFEQPRLVDDEMTGRLAEEHVNAMVMGEIDSIELEFLDEPDANERFFRIGTNPQDMVMPIRVDLD